MVLVEVEAGSLSRGTEITYIQLYNITCQTCSFYVINHCLALVIQYLQISVTKGKDILILHVPYIFSQEYAKIIGFIIYFFTE